VTNPFQVLVFRFLERIGKGVRTAPRDSLISGSIRNNEAGKSFGFHKAMDNSGAIVGPLLAFVLLSLFPSDYRLIFLIAAIPAILGVINIILMIREKKVEQLENRTKIPIKKLPRQFYFFLLIVFVFSLGNSTDALLLIKTSETGIKQSYIPFIYMIFNTVSVLLAIPAGKLSDKKGRGKLILLGFLFYVLVYFLFGAFNHIAVFVFAFILYGAYSAFTDSCQKAMVSDLVSSDARGTGFGLYHAVLGIALLPASVVAGLLYDRVNPGAPFFFGAIMALLASLLMVMFILDTKKSKVSQALHF
jgi:MFS family permease